MTTYRHPNGMIAEYFKTDFVEGYKICDPNGLLVFGDHRTTKEHLIEFGFEEEETEGDRIGNLYKELSCDAELGHKEGNLFPRMTNDFFRQVIEKHMPKRLCRIIKRGDLQGKDFDYIIIDENVTEEQIKELQAGVGKEKEESERDRIDDLIDDIVNGQDVQIRQVIEDNIPKQKKFPKYYVAIYCHKTGNRILEQPMIDFLDAHGLIEK